MHSLNPEVLYFPQQAITAATKEFDTPFFFYSEKRIRENCERVLSTFQKQFPTVQPLFAVKANSNPHILKIIASEGFGFDCSSSVELTMVNRMGSFGMYTGNYVNRDQVEQVTRSPQMILNLDDISTLDFLTANNIPEVISFRINPGVTIESDIASLQFAGGEAKFGVPHEQIVDAYRRAQELGIKRFGIHMMTGSNERNAEYFIGVTNQLLASMAKIQQELGIVMEIMNIGGGFGVPYEPEHESLDLEKVVTGLRESITRHCTENNYPEPQLYLEPGRYITADAGWLVTRVQATKSGYKEFLGVDVTTNAMPRPAIYGAYHHISALQEGPIQKTPVQIVGQICENNDFFGKDRLLPKCAIEDVLIIHNCGAHAFAMSHNYNGMLKPSEILWKSDDSFQLIRRAETIDDYLKTIT